MSSRAFKKLYGENDLKILEQSIASSGASKSLKGEDNSEDEIEDVSAKPRQQNLFALALVGNFLMRGSLL